MSRLDRGEPRLATGTRFGRYAIVRALGSGGMGVVYEAMHTDLRKRVALKVLQSELALDKDARARFLREGEAAARVRHPNVVDVNDVGEHDGQPFLVMEFLEGEDLGTRLARERPLSVEASVELLLPVLAGVSAGHAQGVIHRDLKPQNIFLARGWNGEIVPKVLDFGVSKLLDPADPSLSVTKTGTVCGTVKYMSPEQARGALSIGQRSDQYALGLLLYECVTGQQAYPGDSTLEILHRVATNDFARPRVVRPDLPEPLEQIILRALALDAGHRYDGVLDLGRALLPFASMRANVVWGSTFAPDAAMRAQPTQRLAGAAAPAEPAQTPPTHTRVRDGQPPERTYVVRRSAGRIVTTLLAAAVAGAAGFVWLANRPAPPPVPALARPEPASPAPPPAALRPPPVAPTAEVAPPAGSDATATAAAPSPSPASARRSARPGPRVESMAATAKPRRVPEAPTAAPARHPAAPAPRALRSAAPTAVPRGRNQAPIVR